MAGGKNDMSAPISEMITAAAAGAMLGMSSVARARHERDRHRRDLLDGVGQLGQLIDVPSAHEGVMIVEAAGQREGRVLVTQHAARVQQMSSSRTGAG